MGTFRILLQGYRKNYRLFIVAGAYGTGGEGRVGAKNSIRNGVKVPARNYQVIVAIPNGGGVDKILLIRLLLLLTFLILLRL